MIRTTAGALVLAALGSLAVPARAEPCAGGFAPLAAEVALRAHFVKYPASPAQREEKRDLARAARLLLRGSKSYSRDARTAGQAGGLLLLRYPGDGTIESLVQGALDGLRADVGLERDDLALTGAAFPAGEDRDRADAGVAEADAALAASDASDPLDAEERSLDLGNAARALEAAFRDVLAAHGRRRKRTCGNEMRVVESGGLLWRADRVDAVLQANTNQLVLDGFRVRDPVGDSELQIVVTNVTGTGTYPLSYGSGKWVEDSFTYFGIVEGGSLTITSLDAVAGTAEGTFAFTARGCLFDCSTYEVTGGSFRLRNLTIL